MLFIDFLHLFTFKYPSGTAAYDMKQGKVNVWFSSGGKCYTYRSGIRDLAQKLELIPEFNVNLESERIVKSLLSGQSVIGHIACIDTVRFLLYKFDLNQQVQLSERSKDQYDYETAVFSLISDDKW